MRLLSILILFSLSACATPINRAKTKRHYHEEKVQVQAKAQVKNKKKVDRVKKVTSAKREIIPTKKSFSLDYNKNLYNVWKRFFAKKDKARFLRFLSNGNKYKDTIMRIFKANGLPEELFYVGLIESGYYSHARSHAGASGPWQFMKGTGKQYGLRVDRAVDERFNIHKATQAAASYFKDLYNIFGSWELALCAYNAGEYRIINAIRKGNTRSYRELVKRRLIPKETANYVPKVAAAMDVSKNLYRWAKKNRADRNLFKSAKTVKLSRSFSIKKLAKSMRVPRKVLKKLNPDLKHSWIKVRRSGHFILVPDNVHSVANYYQKAPKRNYSRTKKYRVKRGQNLSVIAGRHGLSVRQIKRLNNLRSSKIYPGQILLVSKKAEKKFHKVRRGEHLTLLANRYGVSIKEIKSANSIRRNTLYVGELLRIPNS